MGTKLQCLKCKDIIESTYRHDFKWCKCGAIFIDGGDDYCRMGGEGLELKQYKFIPKEDKADGNS